MPTPFSVNSYFEHRGARCYTLLHVLYFSQPIGIYGFKGSTLFYLFAIYCLIFSISNRVGSTYGWSFSSSASKKQL